MNAKHPILSEDVKTRIIERWKYSKFNSTDIIAKEFNCHYTQVNKVINDYLKTKIHFR